MRILLLILALCSLSGCYKEQSLEKTLEFSGNNKQELLTVLRHYEKDPQKQEAAKYLIENMRYKYYYSGELLEHYDGLFQAFDSLYRKGVYTGEPLAVYHVWDSLVARYGVLDVGRLEKTYDCQTLSADFLIHNIDAAFRAWKLTPDYAAKDFRSFCEYILPYRVANELPEDYRDDYFNRYVPMLDSVWSDPEKLLKAVELEFVWKQQYRTSLLMWKYPLALPVSKMEKGHRGCCRQLCVFCAQILRACGLPVAVDKVHKWGNRSQGHEWNVLMLKDGKILPFDAFGKERLEFSYKPAKIFRLMYAGNHLPPDAPCHGEVPMSLVNPYEKDVTDQYGPTFDVEIDCVYPDNRRLRPNDYGVICVFDNKQWSPVYWGMKRDGKLVFEKMMGDVCYMAAYYEDGKIYPASEPFILDVKGKQHPVKVNKQIKLDMTLNRKYPRFKRMDVLASQLHLSYLEAANRADFKDADTLFVIKGFPCDINDSIVHANKEYRYFRLLLNRLLRGDLAEIAFYGKEDKEGAEHLLSGKTIGCSVPTEHPYELAMDNDYNTYFSKPQHTDGYVGIDLGEGNRRYVTRVRFAPRSDSNFIVPGDLYELKYWENGKWISAGRQYASEKTTISFEGIPSGTLYLLSDLTKGKEERIFTYEGGKQCWW